MDDRRVAAVLSGLWAGAIAAIAFIAAPAGFAVLQRTEAGVLAGLLFQREAYAGLAVAVVMLLLVKRRAAVAAAAGRGSAFSTDLVLVLAAMFCTIVGYFVVQPMMQQARMGQGPWTFAVLHGASAVLFGVKGLLALVLAWRLSADRP
jgi:hypothetical protein